MVLIIKTDSRKIQVFQQYGLKDNMIKIYENPFTNPRMSGWCVHNCVQEIQPLTYLKSELKWTRSTEQSPGGLGGQQHSRSLLESAHQPFSDLGHSWQVLL